MKKPKKEKIRVEIVSEQGIVKGNFLIEGNRVIMQKESNDRGSIGWNPSFSKEAFLSYYVGFRPFRSLRRKLMIMQDAESFIEFSKEKVNIPTWDKEALENASKAHVLKIAGATTQKVEIPLVIYLILGAILFVGAYSLYLLMQVFGIV